MANYTEQLVGLYKISTDNGHYP